MYGIADGGGFEASFQSKLKLKPQARWFSIAEYSELFVIVRAK